MPPRHSAVRQVSRTSRENPFVSGLHMRVGPYDSRNPPVQVEPEGLLFGRRLGVHVDENANRKIFVFEDRIRSPEGAVDCGHENPSLVDLCRQTGGRLFLGSPTDPQFVVDAAKQASVDLAIVSSDNPLEAGVVDALLAADIKTVGPKRSGARIEWDKAFARNFLKKVAPEFSPQYWIVSTETETRDLFRKLAAEKLEVAVKPQGLTGGKGVKVMGEHLHDFQAAEDYALEVLRDKIGKSTSVVIEEKLEGIEFTVQAVTDGKEFVRVPVTFDFPFRYEGDTGPGTGGMGCISPKGLTLPFMNQHDYEECCRLCRLMLDGLREAGIHYNGVLNAGFFLTARGLRSLRSVNAVTIRLRCTAG